MKFKLISRKMTMIYTEWLYKDIADGSFLCRVCHDENRMIEEEIDWDTQLVMREIANYVLEDELYFYEDLGIHARAHLVWMLHLLFHSGIEEFTEYFRGYYAASDNQSHQMNLEDGNTDTELYQFLEKLDWTRILGFCRKYCNLDTVANRFAAETGFDYSEERSRFPVKDWDGTPRWTMADGKYIASE